LGSALGCSSWTATAAAAAMERAAEAARVVKQRQRETMRRWEIAE